MDLYDHQSADIDALRNLFEAHKRVCYVLPTGGGKTVVAGWMAQRLRQNGRRILIMVHRRELVRQFVATLRSVGLGDQVGVIAAGITPTAGAPIQVASVFSLARRQIQFRPDFIFVDECHHVKATTWEKALHRWPKAYVLGMTATPCRLDGKGLGDWFGVMHCGPSVGALIEMEKLAPVRVLRVQTGFRRAGLKKSGGDYNRSEMEKRATDVVVASTVSAYARHALGKKTIAFAVTQNHARSIVDQCQASGISSAYVGSDTPDAVRDSTFAAFAKGAITLIANVALVDEGFDVRDCECIIDASPTLSVTRYLQRVGRAMRYVEDKEALVLDCVGNSYIHGLPWEDRQWFLDGTEPVGEVRESSKSGPNLRVCSECLTIFEPGLSHCPNCGAAHDGRPVREVDADLVEVTDPGREKREQKRAQRRRYRASLDQAGRLHQAGETVEAVRVLKSAARENGYDDRWLFVQAHLMNIPKTMIADALRQK